MCYTTSIEEETPEATKKESVYLEAVANGQQLLVIQEVDRKKDRISVEAEHFPALGRVNLAFSGDFNLKCSTPLHVSIFQTISNFKAMHMPDPPDGICNTCRRSPPSYA